jgi:hypothetical protein
MKKTRAGCPRAVQEWSCLSGGSRIRWVKSKAPRPGSDRPGCTRCAKKHRSARRAMRFLAPPRSLPLFSGASSPRGTRPASPNVCSGSVQLADRAYSTRGWVFSPNLFCSSPGVSVSKSRWAVGMMHLLCQRTLVVPLKRRNRCVYSGLRFSTQRSHHEKRVRMWKILHQSERDGLYHFAAV